MAAGTTQPDTVPGVEDLAICGREEQDADDWTAIGSEAWLLTVQDPAAAEDPGRMLATTAQWPSARNAIATIYDDGFSERELDAIAWRNWRRVLNAWWKS